MTEEITDGFGNSWDRCHLQDCDLHVVRPGDARCNRRDCATNEPSVINFSSEMCAGSGHLVNILGRCPECGRHFSRGMYVPLHRDHIED